MNPLRVLHIVNSLDAGGMENGLCNLTRVLEPRGIQMSFACLERRGSFAERLPDPGAVHVLGKAGGFSPRAVFRLWRLIRRIRPALLHTHNLGPLLYAAMATVQGRTTPILHGEHSQLQPWELTPKRLRQRRRFYRSCRAIHTVSEAQKAELLQLGFPPEIITAIPNGVDTVRFTPGDAMGARQLLGLPVHGTVLALVGRFGAHKGHGTLLEAFRPVSAELPDVHLAFLGGGGPEEAAIREVASGHPAKARIYFLGLRDDLPRCYPAFDLLVIPSTNEGMSNAALEAMACGVPVLANTGTGSEAIISSGADGWLADLRTPAHLSQEILSLLQNATRLPETGRNARLTIESRFSLERMAATYEALYRRLAP